MSKPGSSWLPMPVTETVHPVLSKILTSEASKATIGSPINKRAIMEVTEFRQPIHLQSHLEMPGILVQLGCIQRT